MGFSGLAPSSQLPGFKYLGDVIEEHGLDDAAGPEYEFNLAKVQVPSVLQRRIHQP